MVPGTPVGSSIVTQRVGIPGKCKLDVATLHVKWSALKAKAAHETKENFILSLWV